MFFLLTLYRASSRCATASSNTIYLHTQSTTPRSKSSGLHARASHSSSGQTSSLSSARDDDDNDDEVRMINRHHLEFVEADSGLVPDLLTSDFHDCAASPCRSVHVKE